MITEDAATKRTRTPRGQGKARLVDAAAALFAEQGVSATSLQAIADRLGVTKAAVYHQFASKDQIVLAVTEPVIERLRQIANEATGMRADAARASVIECLVDLALQERGTAATMRRDPTMAQLLDAHPPYVEQLQRIDALLLGPEPTLEQRIALVFAGGALSAVGARRGLDGPPADVRTALVAAMTRALNA